MYILDTNILSELVKRKPNPNFLQKLKDVPPDLLYTTVISVMELRTGCGKRMDKEIFWKRIEKEILSRVQILCISTKEAIKAGDLLAYMYKKGTPVGVEDTLIASIGISKELTIITANTKHFIQFPEVKVENWLRKDYE